MMVTPFPVKMMVLPTKKSVIQPLMQQEDKTGCKRIKTQIMAPMVAAGPFFNAILTLISDSFKKKVLHLCKLQKMILGW